MATTKQKDSGGAPDVGQAEAQDTADRINEKGYLGVKVDPTPNEHYTVDGVTSGKPTPETDPEYAEKAAAHVRAVARGEVDPNA